MSKEDVEARRARHKLLADTYKSPPDHVHYDWRNPFPAEMADRVKVMRELWEHETHVNRHYNPELVEQFRTRCERAKGHIYGTGSQGFLFEGLIGTAKTAELIVLALNNLPELLDAWEKVHGKEF